MPSVNSPVAVQENAIIQDILAVEIPNLANDKTRYRVKNIPAYSIDETAVFLEKIVTEYLPEIKKLDATDNEDAQAFQKSLQIIQSIYQQGQELIADSVKIRDHLKKAELIDATTKGAETVKKNNALEDTMTTFRQTSDITKALPLIKGKKSYLLASLYQKYLEMSQNTFLLNEANTDLERLSIGGFGLPITSERLGKANYNIDSEARRKTIKERNNTLKKEIDTLKNQEPYQKIIALSSKNEVTHVIKQIDELLKKLKLQEEATLKEINELQLTAKSLELITAILNDSSHDFHSAKTPEKMKTALIISLRKDNECIKMTELSHLWHPFVRDILKVPKSKSTRTQEHLSDFYQNPMNYLMAPVKTVSAIAAFYQENRKEIYLQELSQRIDNKKKSVEFTLNLVHRELEKTHMLIKKLTDIKNKLNSPYKLFSQEKITKLNNLITEISQFSDIETQKNNIETVLKTERLSVSPHIKPYLPNWFKEKLNIKDQPDSLLEFNEWYEKEFPEVNQNSLQADTASINASLTNNQLDNTQVTEVSTLLSTDSNTPIDIPVNNNTKNLTSSLSSKPLLSFLSQSTSLPIQDTHTHTNNLQI